MVFVTYSEEENFRILTYVDHWRFPDLLSKSKFCRIAVLTGFKKGASKGIELCNGQYGDHAWSPPHAACNITMAKSMLEAKGHTAEELKAAGRHCDNLANTCNIHATIGCSNTEMRALKEAAAK